MRISTLAAVWVVFLHAPAVVLAQPAATEGTVQVGVFGYRADGSSASAYDTDPSLDSRVYASGKLCQFGAGYREAPAWAVHAWRFSGRVLSKTADEAVVQLTWQRTLDSGSEIPLPEHVNQLTLRLGDRVTLETVHGGDSACSTNVSFEVRYMPRSAEAIRALRTGAGAIGSHARGTDGTGVGGASVRAGVDGLNAGQARDRGSWMHADLWLVHSAPDRKDEVIHQLVRAPQEGADFAFAPISIATPRGPVVVQVSGSFGVADAHLTFVASRSVKYLFQSGRNGVPDIQGSGRTVNALPESGDVLSFEMPPIPSAPGGAPLPNQLALRVRIAR